MLPEFDLLRPRALPEALEMLADGEAAPIAGGTNLLVDMRCGKHRYPALVDLARLPALLRAATLRAMMMKHEIAYTIAPKASGQPVSPSAPRGGMNAQSQIR